MKKISTYFLVILAFTAISGIPTSASAAEWPLKREIDLSSGFGDIRPNRFHAGVDLRTGGKVGERVFSPVSGYIWRIKMSYEGYGKALYIKGDDGYIYVLAHLSRFDDPIEELVYRRQMQLHRYYLDYYLPDDSARVSQGQLLALSGQTGTKAPHLHFEKRTPDNKPLNPLSHGFEIVDQTPPAFARIGFQMVDNTALFDTGARKMFFPVTPGVAPGVFQLDSVFCFSREFGFLIDCFDKMRRGGMKQVVSHVSLYIDDQLYYESFFDTLNYETDPSVNYEYDYYEAVEDRKRVRRLFKISENAYVGSRGVNGANGVIGKGGEWLGRRHGRIVATDNFGNSSTLNFDFFWVPPDGLFGLDSIVRPKADLAQYYLSSSAELSEYGLDSAVVYRGRGSQWGATTQATAEWVNDHTIVCSIAGKKSDRKLLRLYLFAPGGIIRDNVFSGVFDEGPNRTSFQYRIDEEGLWITITANTKIASHGRLELFYQDSLLGVEYGRMLNMREYVCFIPPQKKYARIDKIGTGFALEPGRFTRFVDTVQFRAVGFDEEDTLNIDGLLTVRIGKKHLARPMYIEIKRNKLQTPTKFGLNSDYYEILPKAFICTEPFEIDCRITSLLQHNEKSGLCWLDKKEDKWVWLDNSGDAKRAKAESIGGGTFAVAMDLEQPEVTHINPLPRKSIFSRRPEILFKIVDTLSGIEDDRSITIKLDGQWMPPEFNPATRICRTKPLHPLEYGEHHLAVEVTDRVGNKTEKYMTFKIAEPRSKGRKKGR